MERRIALLMGLALVVLVSGCVPTDSSLPPSMSYQSQLIPPPLTFQPMQPVQPLPTYQPSYKPYVNPPAESRTVIERRYYGGWNSNPYGSSLLNPGRRGRAGTSLLK
jgi:hypothetical protein